MNKAIKTLLFLPLFLSLLMFSNITLASGGIWKLGPFGPYWDENDWPEYTPMYWMEEFINQLNDNDESIRDWMRASPNQSSIPNQPVPNQGQYQGQYQGQGSNFGIPYGRESFGNNPSAGMSARNKVIPFSMPFRQRNGQIREIIRLSNGEFMPQLSPSEYERMPKNYKAAYRQAFNAAQADYKQRLGQQQFFQNRPRAPRQTKKQSGCFIGR